MRYILLIVLLTGLSGCCSKTTLVLLPDEDGTVGKVEMETRGGSLSLDQPYTSAATQSGRFAPAKTEIGQEKFAQTWGELVAAEPRKPQSFTLNFHSGSVELTEDSIARIPEVVAAMRQDDPVEISIIGHSDAVGDEEYNYTLSLDRAQAVHDLLIAQVPWVKRVLVDSFGENDPLVVTADNVAEPRNRRVEILIR